MLEESRDVNDRYKGRFVVGEFGGQDMLKNIVPPGDAGEVVHVSADIKNSDEEKAATAGAPASVTTHVDMANRKFLEGKELDGSFDRCFGFNVLSVARPTDGGDRKRVSGEEFVPLVLGKVGRMLRRDGIAVFAEWHTPTKISSELALFVPRIAKFGLQAKVFRKNDAALGQALGDAGVGPEMAASIRARLPSYTDSVEYDQPFVIVLKHAKI